MSGGCWNYVQHQVQDVIDDLEHTLEVNEECFSEDTLIELEVAIRFIKMAKVYIVRADWLLAGDDSEETFKERLSEDLKEVLRDNPSA